MDKKNNSLKNNNTIGFKIKVGVKKTFFTTNYLVQNLMNVFC